MAKPFIQTSFNSGEWAPNLWARTDIDKYRSGAALLHNFFVDFRGGASTRSATKYIIRAYKDSTAVRLIGFQASISLGYVLEFGNLYIRFHKNGAPVLETGLNITAATKASPCVLTVTNSYTTGDVDWVYVTGVGGMTQLNGKYYIVHARDATHVTLYDLFGNPVDSTGYSTYTAGGTTSRIYTIASPYAAADLATLKFAQNVSVMIFTHPSYAPYQLVYTSATSWAMTAITIGSTVTKPNNLTAGTTGVTISSGSYNYSYIVTALDTDLQESEVSTRATLASTADMRLTAGGTIILSWDPVAGATSYNVYKAVQSFGVAVPVGQPYGYIGNSTSTTMTDTNITPDFSQPPPIAQNPFAPGSKVTSATITVPGSYTTAPTCTFSAPVAGGTTATGTPLLGVLTAVISAAGANYNVGDTVTLVDGIILTVATLAGAPPNAIATVTITAIGSAATLPANPVSQSSTSGSGTGATFTLTWKVTSIAITVGGTGYVDPTNIPTITFSAGAAAATAVLGPASNGYPAVPAFFQQRLVLGGPNLSPPTLNMSQPGSYYNFNISNPIQDDDAISATIVGAQLANIKALIAQPGGLIVYSDDGTVLLNGGALGAPVTPASITANAQSHVGCNDMPPIVSNFDILTVQSKGSSVRDSTYNFYANVYTGTDISVISSHLFFGYQLTSWAWAEEPYKIVWAVRNDGTALSLTFIKDQEFTAWAHHTTEALSGLFKSVCTVVEAATAGYQNFTYWVVQRTIGVTTVQYIEYFPERPVSTSAQDYWTVDCAISYSGSATTSFQGGEFLAGKTVTGLADGLPITPFTMAASGNFTLGTAASNVKVGLAFNCDLQTLYIDLGNQAATVQSKMKQLPQATIRVAQTLGLTIGSSSSDLVTMKDLVIGNVGSMSNALVTALVTGDARTILDPKWQEPGQVYIRQSQPYPASILGYIPQVNVPVDK